MFIWCGVVRNAVCGGELRVESKPQPSDNPSRRREPSTPADDKPRIPYDATGVDFEEVTRNALQLAGTDETYGGVLSLLADCYPLEHLAYEQDRGASYKRLAAIATTSSSSWTKDNPRGDGGCVVEPPMSDNKA